MKTQAKNSISKAKKIARVDAIKKRSSTFKRIDPQAMKWSVLYCNQTDSDDSDESDDDFECGMEDRETREAGFVDSTSTPPKEEKEEKEEKDEEVAEGAVCEKIIEQHNTRMMEILYKDFTASNELCIDLQKPRSGIVRIEVDIGVNQHLSPEARVDGDDASDKFVFELEGEGVVSAARVDEFVGVVLDRVEKGVREFGRSFFYEGFDTDKSSCRKIEYYTLYWGS